MKRVHSISLPITNSSTTTFVIPQNDALQNARELCEKLHKTLKLPNTWQDYFEVKLTCDTSTLRDPDYEDILKKIDKRYSDLAKIQEYIENEPDEFFKAVEKTARNNYYYYYYILDAFKVKINTIGSDIDLANLDLYYFDSMND
jgi:hypothetical protein